MFSLAYGSRALGSGVIISLGLVLAACGGGSSNSASQAATAKGPINIWYSNNAEEITWGTATVAAWNTAHADQTIAADQIPAGKSSEEVIGAAITAGTTPCLIFNTAPAAVPQFQKAVGLVSSVISPTGLPLSKAARATEPASTSHPTASTTRCRGRPIPS